MYPSGGKLANAATMLGVRASARVGSALGDGVGRRGGPDARPPILADRGSSTARRAREASRWGATRPSTPAADQRSSHRVVNTSSGNATLKVTLSKVISVRLPCCTLSSTIIFVGNCLPSMGLTSVMIQVLSNMPERA